MIPVNAADLSTHVQRGFLLAFVRSFDIVRLFNAGCMIIAKLRSAWNFRSVADVVISECVAHQTNQDLQQHHETPP
jgi:hypothetical protein